MNGRTGALGRFSTTERGLIVLIVAAVLLRLFARPNAVFWIDEAATGSIVIEKDWGTVADYIQWHVSSPLYFGMLKLWSEVFGYGNVALRFPSAIFSAAAPLCIALCPVAGIERRDRLFWAALFALWLPGIGFGQAARPYALEMFFSAAQTLAFAWMLAKPTTRTTYIWVAMCSATIMTHYLSGILAIFQGLLFVALHPRVALRNWHSGVLVIPAFAMLAWQWPEMSKFMQPHTVWYRLFDGNDFQYSIFYIFGSVYHFLAVPALVLFAAILGYVRQRDPVPPLVKAMLVGAPSAMAAVALLIWAMYTPMLTNRYLTPVVPGILLMLVAGVRMLARSAPQVIIWATLSASIVMAGLWLRAGAKHPDSVAEDLNYQVESDWLMNSGVKSVVFVWDNPNSRAMHLEQITAYGRFFFDRAGYEMEVIPARSDEGVDLNAHLMALARPHRSAILLGDRRNVVGTFARMTAPAIDELDPSYSCRTRHRDKTHIYIVSCVPR